MRNRGTVWPTQKLKPHANLRSQNSRANDPAPHATQRVRERRPWDPVHVACVPRHVDLPRGGNNKHDPHRHHLIVSAQGPELPRPGTSRSWRSPGRIGADPPVKDATLAVAPLVTSPELRITPEGSPLPRRWTLIRDYELLYRTSIIDIAIIAMHASLPRSSNPGRRNLLRYRCR